MASRCEVQMHAERLADIIADQIYGDVTEEERWLWDYFDRLPGRTGNKYRLWAYATGVKRRKVEGRD